MSSFEIGDIVKINTPKISYEALPNGSEVCRVKVNGKTLDCLIMPVVLSKAILELSSAVPYEILETLEGLPSLRPFVLTDGDPGKITQVDSDPAGNVCVQFCIPLSKHWRKGAPCASTDKK